MLRLPQPMLAIPFEEGWLVGGVFFWSRAGILPSGQVEFS